MLHQPGEVTITTFVEWMDLLLDKSWCTRKRAYAVLHVSPSRIRQIFGSIPREQQLLVHVRLPNHTPEDIWFAPSRLVFKRRRRGNPHLADSNYQRALVNRRWHLDSKR